MTAEGLPRHSPSSPVCVSVSDHDLSGSSFMTRPSKRFPRWLDDPEASVRFSSAMNLEAQCVSWFLSPWSHLGCLHCLLPAPGLHPVPATLPQGLSSLGSPARVSETWDPPH